jgi:hypothetical protein
MLREVIAVFRTLLEKDNWKIVPGTLLYPDLFVFFYNADFNLYTFISAIKTLSIMAFLSSMSTSRKLLNPKVVLVDFRIY